jgi:hypothetical protein
MGRTAYLAWRKASARATAWGNSGAVDTQLRTQRGAVCVLEIWNVIRSLRAGEAAKRFV